VNEAWFCAFTVSAIEGPLPAVGFASDVMPHFVRPQAAA
jgi:hypothetical protein